MWGMWEGGGGGRCGVKFVVLASEPAVGGDPGRPSCLVIHASLAAK